MKMIKKILATIFGLVGTAMILIVTYAVFSRDVLKISVAWSDEMLKLLDIWMIFVVSSVVFYDEETIALTLLEDSNKIRSDGPKYHIIKIIQYLITGAVSIELIRELVTIIQTQMTTWEVTTVIKYPLWILNLGMLIGSVLTAIFAVIKIADAGKHFHEAPGILE
ncbi:TRAP transporter small permease [Oribacterium sp. HCP28S3_H8]|jgi:TRAP-type C4-dicarboxylate transport system permease small subunit|uniref:TRAP transporter small permease n=1 Tax=Oribacterium sp. HCP28S3_H8 TaxID=3438945 RepID=UPI003F8B857A